MTTNPLRVDHLSTPEEITQFAHEGNHGILSKCIQVYRHGQCTWEQAMQSAAIHQAETIQALYEEYIKLAQRIPGGGI